MASGYDLGETLLLDEYDEDFACLSDNQENSWLPELPGIPSRPNQASSLNKLYV